MAAYNPGNAMKRSMAHASFYKGGQIGGDNGSVMDTDMAAKCLMMSRTCAEIRSCIAYLKTNILAKGIEMTRKAQTTTHDFHVHMQEYYTRFCADVLEVAVTIGVVPYILVKNGKGYGYPMVLKPDAGTLRVTYAENGSAKYTFSSNGSESTKSRVFFEIFNDLGRSGELCSVVSSLVPAYDFVQTQEFNTFIANEINARPPIFLTTGTDAFTEKDIVNRDVYGAGIIAEQEFESQMMRNRIQLNVVQAQKTYLKYMSVEGNGAPPDFFGATRDRLSGYPVVDYTQGTSFQPEFVPLPNDCRPTAATMPHAPNGLEMHREHFRTLVCMAFAIPSNVLTGNMSASAGNAASDLMAGSLKHAFEFMKNKLATMCLKSYRLLHEDSSEDVKILFPSLTNVSMYEKLYHEGVLKYDAYKEQLSKSFDIPLTSFEKEPRLVMMPGPNGQPKPMLPHQPDAPAPVKRPRLELGV